MVEPPTDTRGCSARYPILSLSLMFHRFSGSSMLPSPKLEIAWGMGAETKRRPAVARVSLSGNRSVGCTLALPALRSVRATQTIHQATHLFAREDSIATVFPRTFKFVECLFNVSIRSFLSECSQP